jgi:hypothetical protein
MSDRGCLARIWLKLGLAAICILTFALAVKITVTTRDAPNAQAAALKSFFEYKMKELNATMTFAIAHQNETVADMAFTAMQTDFENKAYQIFQTYEEATPIMLAWFVFGIEFVLSILLCLCY